MFKMWNSICELDKNFENYKQEKDHAERDLFLCIENIENIQNNICDLSLEIGYQG